MEFRCVRSTSGPVSDKVTVVNLRNIYRNNKKKYNRIKKDSKKITQYEEYDL